MAQKEPSQPCPRWRWGPASLQARVLPCTAALQPGEGRHWLGQLGSPPRDHVGLTHLLKTQGAASCCDR